MSTKREVQNLITDLSSGSTYHIRKSTKDNFIICIDEDEDEEFSIAKDVLEKLWMSACEIVEFEKYASGGEE